MGVLGDKIVIYPTMALYAERLIHGANSHGRKFSPAPNTNEGRTDAIEIQGLTKFILQPYARDYSLAERS